MELHDIYPEFSAAFRGGFSFADTRLSVSLCKGTPKYNCPKSATQRIDEKTFMWYNEKKRRNRCFFAVFLLMNGMKNHCKKVVPYYSDFYFLSQSEALYSRNLW